MEEVEEEVEEEEEEEEGEEEEEEECERNMYNICNASGNRNNLFMDG